MCIIFTCSEGRPDETKLRLADTRNPHGIGIAWPDKAKGVVRWKKGLKLSELLAMLPKMKFPYMIHFRTASIGGVRDELTHPFPILPGVPLDLEGAAPSVLMHNGHWSEWEEELKKSIYSGGVKIPQGPWSDSRALAYLAERHGETMLEFVRNNSDRIAVMLPTGITWTWGTWDKFPKDGYWQSCPLHSYKDYRDEKGGGTTSPLPFDEARAKEEERVAGVTRSSWTSPLTARMWGAPWGVSPEGAFTIPELAGILLELQMRGQRVGLC